MNYTDMTRACHLSLHFVTRRARRSFVRVARAGLILAISAAVLPLVGHAPASGEGLAVTGTLPRFPADAVAAFGNKIKPAFNGDNRGIYGGTLVSIPTLGQVWQLYPTSVNAAGPTAVAVRRADTAEMIHTFETPVGLRRITGDFGGDWIHAIDGDRRIFFFNDNATKLVIIDLKTYATQVRDLPDPWTVAGRPPLLVPASLDYDPIEDAVFSTFGGVQGLNAAQVVTVLMRYTLKDGEGDGRQIRVCNGQLTPIDQGFTSQFENIIGPKFGYFVCQRVGSIGAVVRIERDEEDGFMDPGSDEVIVAGPAYLDTALADPASNRIFLMTIAGEIWAFDTTTMAFVGVISAAAEGQQDPRVGYGLDRETGRIFSLSSNFGLGVAEGRFFPIPQARTYTDEKAPGQERLISDAKSGRLYVLTGTGANRAAAYKIYDVGTAPLPPAPPDPDGNTTDAEEQPGVNQSRYFASGTGYGARVLLAKGISAVPPAPAAGQVAPTASLINDRINSKCGYSDRELVAGRVAKAEYETGSTAAEAIGVDVDERTKLDLAHISRCDVTVRDGREVFAGIFSLVPKDYKENTPDYDKVQDWTRKSATCTSSEGGDPDDGASEGERPSSASVTCPVPGGRLDAAAVGYLNGAVSVGRSQTTTSIKRAKGGIVAEVVAEAQDITIADVVFIGEVTSKATSAATGRPPAKRPMSAHEVVVKGVRVVTPDQGEQWICRGVCDLDETTRRLNLLMGGRIEFKTKSGLDEALQHGSARGAQTAVQKSAARQASDQALIGDRTTEVAGLEMVMYNDNKPFGRARQIYQFAGVSTAATYNIMRVPTGFGFDDLPDSGDGGASFDEGAFQPDGAIGDAWNGMNSLEGVTVAAEGGSGNGRGDTFPANVFRAVARGLRLFFTDPRQAALLLTAWGLFSLPVVLTRRRRLLAGLHAE